MLKPSLIVTIVRRGWGDTVLEASVKAGAQGGTVLFGRGAGIRERERILGIPIEPEKEIVLTCIDASLVETVLQEIVRAADLNKPGMGLALVLPVEKVVGVTHSEDERSP